MEEEPGGKETRLAFTLTKLLFPTLSADHPCILMGSCSRRNPPRSAAPYLRRQAARGWPHSCRLQHPEGVYSPLGPQVRLPHVSRYTLDVLLVWSRTDRDHLPSIQQMAGRGLISNPDLRLVFLVRGVFRCLLYSRLTMKPSRSWFHIDVRYFLSCPVHPAPVDILCDFPSLSLQASRWYH